VSSQRLPNDPAEALHWCCQCHSPEDWMVPFLLPYIVAVCYYHTLLPCRHFWLTNTWLCLAVLSWVQCEPILHRRWKSTITKPTWNVSQLSRLELLSIDREFVAYVQGLCPECVSALPTSDDSAWQNSTRVHGQEMWEVNSHSFAKALMIFSAASRPELVDFR